MFSSINKIKEVLNLNSLPNTLYVFDLDNTVLRPTKEEDLGSDQWFSTTFNMLCQFDIDASRAIVYLLELNNMLQKYIKIKLVEPETKEVITNLLASNFPVIALTSRGGKDLVNTTLQQLAALNIEFTHLHTTELTLDLGVVSRHVTTYTNGIIFCDGADKGKCLKAYFDAIGHKPAHVVMVDDVKSHLDKVKAVLESEENPIPFTPVHYTHTELRVSGHNIKRSTSRLFAIANTNPDVDSHLDKPIQVKETFISIKQEMTRRLG